VAENYRMALQGLHVLVVDDDEDSRVLMQTMLRYYGAFVTAVDSAKAARRALEQARAHVIVCDLAMPEEDGLTLIRELRRDPNSGGTPALAVTAYGHQYSADALREAGFTGILRKPLNPDEFARAVVALGAVPRRREGKTRRRTPSSDG